MHLWTVYYKILNGLQFKLNIAAGNMHNHLLLGAFCVCFGFDVYEGVELTEDENRSHVVDSLGNRNFVLLLIRNANTVQKCISQIAYSKIDSCIIIISIVEPSFCHCVIGLKRMSDANEI